MEQVVGSDAESKLISILRVLSESSEPLGSITIARRLEGEGVFLSERAVRYHLRIADERGYTQPVGRDGRMITPEGRQEVKEALAPQQLGFVREKLELLAYQTTFDPEKRTGQLPINTSLIDKDKFKKALSAMKDAFRARICVSELVATASEGEKLGSVVVPEWANWFRHRLRCGYKRCAPEGRGSNGVQVWGSARNQKFQAETVRGYNRLCWYFS